MLEIADLEVLGWQEDIERSDRLDDEKRFRRTQSLGCAKIAQRCQLQFSEGPWRKGKVVIMVEETVEKRENSHLTVEETGKTTKQGEKFLLQNITSHGQILSRKHHFLIFNFALSNCTGK